MLPKTGDSAKRTTGDPSLYWIPRTRYLQKPLYGRLPATLEMEQSCHQTGVRPHTVLKMHSLFFKPSVAKPKNGIAPFGLQTLIWTRRLIASNLIFLEALQQQHVPKSYCALLWNLYRNQKGCISGSEVFDIERGVQQSDVISPLLFNAGVEHALRKWKRKSKNHKKPCTSNWCRWKIDKH